MCRGADKSLARPGKKQARKHVTDARDFNNMETRTVVKFCFPLQGKAPKEIHAILTETIACLLPGRAKDLSAPLYILVHTCSSRVSTWYSVMGWRVGFCSCGIHVMNISRAARWRRMCGRKGRQRVKLAFHLLLVTVYWDVWPFLLLLLLLYCVRDY